jgi:Na+/serine symporter
LSFDYSTTFKAIGPNHPGTWTLYAVDGTGATLALLTGNLQIKKVTSSQVYPSTTSVDVPTKLICKQGSTFTRTVTWSQDGVPVNVTGYTAAMQVRSSYTSATAVVSLTSGAGITLGGTAGTIQITISAAATAGIPAGNYVYDLELTSGGTVTRLLEGQFIVTPEVTV